MHYIEKYFMYYLIVRSYNSTLPGNKIYEICWSGISWKQHLHKQICSCSSYSVFNHLYNLATGRQSPNKICYELSLNTNQLQYSKFDTKAFSGFIITSCFAFQALFSENLFSIMFPLSLKISWYYILPLYLRNI